MAKVLNILIACEESQTECSAFLARGCNCYSCDLQPCSGKYPERHIIGDVRSLFAPNSIVHSESGEQIIVPKWHMIIAHPPCTFLSRAASAFLYRGGHIDKERFAKGLEAAHFFHEMLNAPAHFVAVENPVPFRVFNLPPPSCAVNPSDFGEPWLKKTLYWLRNLPPLMSTIIHPTPRSFVYYTRGGKKRSKSFPCIAEAMAEQWLPIVYDYFFS